MVNMKYTNEIITFDGTDFKVLNLCELDFSKTVYGIKKALTKVVKAKKGV